MTPRHLKLLRRLLARRSYALLRSRLAGERLEFLLAAWPGLDPMSRLVLFKLMDPLRAMEFYGALPYADRYHLFCGFPLDAIAPVLEPLEESERRLFHKMPRDYYERMFRDLSFAKSSPLPAPGPRPAAGLKPVS